MPRIKDVPCSLRRGYKAKCVAEHNKRYALIPLHVEALEMDRVWMEKNRPWVLRFRRSQARVILAISDLINVVNKR